ncbi:diacylglycerol kinase [Rickettsiales bacterium]|nr:diacylglycerol kinase [Rickettsiales bacterium]
MKRIYKALFYSIDGIISAWRDEPAFRQEVFLAILMIPAAFYFAPDKISLILMIGSILMVFCAEIINTSIEAVVDRFGDEIHPLSKKAKDTASAAVLIALLNAGIVWAVILFF